MCACRMSRIRARIQRGSVCCQASGQGLLHTLTRKEEPRDTIEARGSWSAQSCQVRACAQRRAAGRVAMKAVVQRVRAASVAVGGGEVARIGPGLLVLLGVAVGDGPAEAAWLARRIAGLRIFADEAGKMNRAVAEVGGSILAVSQFTLLGDCRAGRRPGFAAAAPPAGGPAALRGLPRRRRRRVRGARCAPGSSARTCSSRSRTTVPSRSSLTKIRAHARISNAGLSLDNSSCVQTRRNHLRFGADRQVLPCWIRAYARISNAGLSLDNSSCVQTRRNHLRFEADRQVLLCWIRAHARIMALTPGVIPLVLTPCSSRRS